MPPSARLRTALKCQESAREMLFFCPPAEEDGSADETRAVSRGWAFAGWHRLCGHSSACVTEQTTATADWDVETRFGRAVCVVLGPKESLGVPSERPALLFSMAEVCLLCASFHATHFPYSGVGSWTTSCWNNSLWVSGAGNSFVCVLPTCRSVRGSLESSLFEAQQHSSQLEIARSQLEAQLQAVTQAKEVIQGESLECFVLVLPRPEGWCKYSSLPTVLLRSEGAGDRSFLH